MTKSWLAPTLLAAVLIGGLVLVLGLGAGEAPAAPAMSSPLEPALLASVGWLSAGAEITAALVIASGVLRSGAVYARTGWAGRANVAEIRLELGRTLALGLELTIASDILRTAVAPSREELVNLAAIVLLRTLLNRFLGQELAETG